MFAVQRMFNVINNFQTNIIDNQQLLIVNFTNPSINHYNPLNDIFKKEKRNKS